MSENNPYAIPKAEITPFNTGEIEFNESKWYSVSGRIGRLRYLAYSVVFNLIVTIVTLILAFVGTSELMINTTSLIVSIPFLMFIYPTRRLNDLGKSGWITLYVYIVCIVFVALGFVSVDPTIMVAIALIIYFIFYLYLIFAKGNPEENKYGNPPRPNQWYHWVLALVIPVLSIIGILAALALPAYQDYTERAQAAKIQAELNAQSFEQGQQ